MFVYAKLGIHSTDIKESLYMWFFLIQLIQIAYFISQLVNFLMASLGGFFFTEKEGLSSKFYCKNMYNG